jgi:hypothetical protein
MRPQYKECVRGGYAVSFDGLGGNDDVDGEGEKVRGYRNVDPPAPR